jgi:SAM-dependent methyltransferase
VSLSERIFGNAVLYDAVQRAAGMERLRQRLSPVLGDLEAGTLLDVGAGTGAFYDLLPERVKYVALDVDARKLERLRAKHRDVERVVGSASALPFEDRAFDYTLCTNVAHHLSDTDFERLVAELGRVTSRQLVFVDPLRVDRVASRLLWRIDRGSYSRSHEQLVERLSSQSAPKHVEAFTILHRYLLFVGGRIDG